MPRLSSADPPFPATAPAPAPTERGAAAVLESVLGGLPTAVAVLDGAGTVRAVNARWRELAAECGWEAECAPGRPYADVCRHGVHDAAVEEGIRAVAAGECGEFSAELSVGPERVFAVRAAACPGTEAAAVVSYDDVSERRRAEAAERRGESRFRALIENSADLIVILDAAGRIRYESPAVRRILGYEAAERVGASFFDWVDAQDLPHAVEAFARALARPGENVPLGFRTRHRGGAARIVEGTAKSLLHDPAVAGIVVNAREVTARKRAEEAAARLTAVVDSTPDFVATTDPHGRVTYLNRAGRRMLEMEEGRDAAELNLPVVHPAWANHLLLHEGIPTAVREGAWSGESALLDARGREVPVLQVVIAHRDPRGEVSFLSTIARDITELKRSQEELRESHEMFRQLAENINETLWIFDLGAGRPVYVSPGYERIWGRSLEAAFADPATFLECVSPADRQHVSRVPGEGEEGEREELLYRIDHPDGGVRWLRGRSFPIRDGRGRVCRIAGLTEDVTVRRRLEEELQRAQKLEALGQLGAGVAHEINTPVQYVGDNVRFLESALSDLARLCRAQTRVADAVLADADRMDADRSDADRSDGDRSDADRGDAHRTDADRADAAELARAAGVLAEEVDLEYLLEEAPRAAGQALEGLERVAEIVQAMKEFSHPGGSGLTPVDLNRVVQNAVTVARNAWKRVAELRMELDPALPPVPCLPGDVGQAVLDLVVNAAQAVADVVGEDGERGRGVITVTSRGDGEWAEVRVADTGTGIPEAAQPRVFDPFFTTRPVGRGTGKGLTLAHATIVDRHGGSLRFETEAGVGTVFILRLPMAGRAASIPAERGGWP
jgi:PAS domain S-box-containing protein